MAITRDHRARSIDPFHPEATDTGWPKVPIAPLTTRIHVRWGGVVGALLAGLFLGWPLPGGSRAEGEHTDPTGVTVAPTPEEEQPPSQAKSRPDPAAPAAPEGDFVNSIGMKMVRIKEGSFLMGAPEGQKGGSHVRPVRRVEITQPFYLGAYEVTVGQFRAFVDATGFKTHAEGTGQKFNWRTAFKHLGENHQTDNHPVIFVTWNEAVRFCAWLSQKEGRDYRLPTEAQWEYSCRAGTQTDYSFGDDPAELNDYAWHSQNSKSSTQPIGSKKPNAWGLYDMLGNVAEWCQDVYDENYYKTRPNPDRDPQGPVLTGKKDLRVVRGSAWLGPPVLIYNANRAGYDPNQSGPPYGFRVAASVTPKKP